MIIFIIVQITLNPIALRKAKIVYNFDLSECNRVKGMNLFSKQKIPSVLVAQIETKLFKVSCLSHKNGIEIMAVYPYSLIL